MIRIVCYGDSNTWGYNPLDYSRYSEYDRWTSIIKKWLSPNYDVIEEGLCGRTTVIDDPTTPYRSGKEYLIPCLESHKPVDLVIIMLGTNDLKKRFSLEANDIALGAGTLINMIKNSDFGPLGEAPKVLLICPPVVREIGEFAENFKGAEEKSSKLPQYYSEIAKQYYCRYLDLSSKILSSNIDGIHLDKSEHIKLATYVFAEISSIFW